MWSKGGMTGAWFGAEVEVKRGEENTIKKYNKTMFVKLLAPSREQRAGR
jgi:hypothetical protein